MNRLAYDASDSLGIVSCRLVVRDLSYCFHADLCLASGLFAVSMVKGMSLANLLNPWRSGAAHGGATGPRGMMPNWM